MSITPEDRDRSGTDAPPPRYRDAFAVADELAVHGSDCVCPRCAGRLPGLLSELARAIEKDTAGDR
jgi:hypothetical protein